MDGASMVVIAREFHDRALGVLPNGVAVGVGCARAAPVAYAVAGDAAAEVAGFEGGGLGGGGGVRAGDGVGVDGEREDEG